LTTCLNFYHDLGAIIYFGNANDIFLRNTIILRPQKLVDIFNMILNAKLPTSFSKLKNTATFHDNAEISQSVQMRQSNSVQPSNIKWIDLWENFDKRGILSDHLLDVLWKSVIDQKPGLLGLMKKFDFICEKTSNGNNLEVLNREYFVPSRARINYDQDFDETFNPNDQKEKINGAYEYYDEFEDDDGFEVKKFNENKCRLNEFNLNIPIVEFYYDFGGFLPGKLFYLNETIH
jgi:hypothetical protein